MSTKKINLQRLRRLINEEIAAVVVNETVDHKNISSVVGVVSKLLAAVEGFKKKAPPAAVNAVTPHLSNLEKVLEDMMSSPASYVPMPKKEPKKVTLKAVKAEGKLRETGNDYPSEMEVPGMNEPCSYCGSENTEQLDDVPSMAGYGHDSGVRCLDCKKITWSGPEMS